MDLLVSTFSRVLSLNLAAFHDINGKVLCELLPSDLYNNSDKLVPSQSHHHYSIAVSWKRKNVHSVFIKHIGIAAIAKAGFLKLFKNTPKS